MKSAKQIAQHPSSKFVIAFAILFSSIPQAHAMDEYLYGFQPIVQNTSRQGPFEHEFLPGELEKKQTIVAKFWNQLKEKKGGIVEREDVINLYKLADSFLIIHGLIGNVISGADSLHIGTLRREMHHETLKAIAKSMKFGTRFGVNDFEYSGNIAEADAIAKIEFTPFCDDQSIEGADMVKHYREVFTKITGLSPEKMNIVPVPYEANTPDWQQSRGTADLANSLRQKISLLKTNPEAVFLEDAYQLPLMGQRNDVGQKTFTWYIPDHKGNVNTKVENAALQKAFFYHPEVSDQYAWGASIANWHFFNANDQDIVDQAKNVLHSLDDGVGLLLGSQKTANFLNLSPLQQQGIIQTLYGNNFTPEELERIQAALESTVNIIEKKHKVDFTTNEGLLKAYEPLINFEKRRSVVKLSDADILTASIESYQRTCQLILIENNLICSKTGFKDWLGIPIQADDTLVVVYQDGTAHRISVNHDLLRHIQFSSFFELRHALKVMNEAMIAQLTEQNPLAKDDIETLTNLFSKTKEMFTAPEKISEAAATSYRHEQAIQCLADYLLIKQRLKNSPYSSSSWKSGEVQAIRETDFAKWLQNLIKERVASAMGGTAYVPILQKLTAAIQGTDTPLLEPLWLAQIDKTQPIIEILKTYAREGVVNPNVLTTALTEGMNYLPGISSLYAIKGDLAESSTFNLVRTIPDAGQITLHCHLINGRIELTDLTAYKPIENEELQAIYQGGIISGEKQSPDKKTSENSHPLPFLFPFDPDHRLSIEEAREKMYDYFQTQIMLMIKNDHSIWYTEEEKPKEWQQKEMDFLHLLVKEYVQDWWNGTGPFENSLIPSAKDSVKKPKDLQEVLIKQVISDYITGKTIAIEHMIKEKNEEIKALIELFKQIAELDSALDKEGDGQRNNYETSGNLILAYVLDQMPEAASSVELLSVPHVTLLEKDDKNDPDRFIAYFINIRAALKASLKNHPGPWKLKWTFSPLTTEQKPKGRVLTAIIAAAVDGNKKEFANQTITIEADRYKMEKRSSEYPSVGSAADKELLEDIEEIKEQMQGMAKLSAKTAIEVQSNCTTAEKRMTEAIAAVSDLQDKLLSYEPTFSHLLEVLQPLTEQAAHLEGYIKAINENEAKLADAKAKAEAFASQACNNLDQISNAKSSSERKELLKRTHEIKEDLVKLHKSSLETLTKAFETYKKIYLLKDSLKATSQKIEILRSELTSMDFTSRAAKKGFEQGMNAFDDSLRGVDLLGNNVSLSASLVKEFDAKLKRFKHQPITSNAIHKEILSLDESMKAARSSVKDCPKDQKKLIANFDRKLENYDKALRKSFDKIDQLIQKLHLDDLTVKIDAAAENTNINRFNVELYWDGISESLHEAEKCERLGKEVVQALTTQSMPDVRGLSVNDATNKLTEMKLKVKRIGGQSAPNDELSFKVESQVPLAGTSVKPGDIVTITIYGQHRQILPDVRGMTLKEAMSKLSELQLRVKRVGGDPAPSEDLSYKVEFQTPAPGTKITAGDFITLTLYGKYSPVATMPDLVGLQQDQALDKLKALDLKPVILTGDAPPTRAKANSIQSQSPEAGKQIPAGSEVSITIYGSFESVVPDVIGLDAEDARDLLQSEGLTVVLKEGDRAPTSSQENKVYLQYPIAGAKNTKEREVVLSIYAKALSEGQSSSLKLPPTNTTPFYVVCDNFMATPAIKSPDNPAADSSKQPTGNALSDLLKQLEYPVKNNEQAKNEEWIKSLTVQDVSFTAGEDPVIFYVNEQGLRFYDPSFFQHRKQLSTILNIHVKEESQSHTINGALLLEVAAIFKTSEALYEAYPKARQVRNGFSYILNLSGRDGTFHYSAAQDGAQITIDGGPLREGWPALMKERNLEMVKHIKLLFKCFIATAIYDSWKVPQLDSFRKFRDKIMLPTEPGKNLVHIYYAVGPKIAPKLVQHPGLKPILLPFFNSLAFVLEHIDYDQPVIKKAFEILMDAANWIISPFFSHHEAKTPMRYNHV